MDNEDSPYNLDEFFADPGFFNVQDLVQYPPGDTELNDSNCPSNTFNFSSFGEILNRAPQLEKGDSSTHPRPQPLNLEDNSPDTSKVLTECIPTQDHTSMDYNQDYGAQQHRRHQPLALTSRLTHTVSQKRRRDRVKEKMKTLKDLIPNCDKKDMASVLDEAIKYIKSLKLQAQYYGWYQQQVQARTRGGGQIPVVSPVASSLVRAPPYLQYYDLHQPHMVLPYHPMNLMQPSQPIPQISTTSTSTSTSTAEID